MMQGGHPMDPNPFQPPEKRQRTSSQCPPGHPGLLGAPGWSFYMPQMGVNPWSRPFGAPQLGWDSQGPTSFTPSTAPFNNPPQSGSSAAPIFVSLSQPIGMPPSRVANDAMMMMPMQNGRNSMGGMVVIPSKDPPLGSQGQLTMGGQLIKEPCRTKAGILKKTGSIRAPRIEWPVEDTEVVVESVLQGKNKDTIVGLLQNRYSGKQVCDKIQNLRKAKILPTRNGQRQMEANEAALPLEEVMKRRSSGEAHGKLQCVSEVMLQALADIGKMSRAKPHGVAPDAYWDKMYELLIEWKDDPAGGKGKQCNVPRSGKYKGENLGWWLSDQRSRKRRHSGKKVLSECQEAKLQSLVDDGFLSWDPIQGYWEKMYELLLRYRDDEEGGNGNCNAPQSCKYKGENLGWWLSDQRRRYRGKGNTPLSGSQFARLQALVDDGELYWDTVEGYWDKMFGLMVQWGDEETGGEHYNVPQGLVYEGERLGKWLNNQRSRRRGDKGTTAMSASQRAKLKALVDADKLWW